MKQNHRLVVAETEADKKFMMEWVERRLYDVKFDNAEAIGVLVDGVVTAVVLFHNFRPPNIEVSLAIDKSFMYSKSLVKKIFSYPFDILGCGRMTAYCNKKNKKARKLIEGLGFEYEGNMRKAGPNNIDVIIYGLLREK